METLVTGLFPRLEPGASSSVDVTGATPRTHLQPFPPGLFHRLPLPSSAHPLPPASIPRSQPSDEHGSLGRVSVMDDATRCGTSGPSRDVRAPLPAERATRLDTLRARERRGELEREGTQAVLEAAVGCVLSGVGSVSVRASDVSDARDGAGGIGSAGRGGLGEVTPIGMARHGGLGEAAPIGWLHVAGETATPGLHRGEPLGAGLGAGRQDIGMAPPGLDGIDVVELDTLTPPSHGVRGKLSSSCRATCRVACRVTVEFPVELSRPGLNFQLSQVRSFSPSVERAGCGPRLSKFLFSDNFLIAKGSVESTHRGTDHPELLL